MKAQFANMTANESDEHFAVFACRPCRLKQTLPIPSDLSLYYPQHYHGRRHGFTAQYCAKRRLNWVNKWVKKPGKILDIGCGEGTFLLSAKKQGFLVYGTEIAAIENSHQTITIAKTLQEMKKHGPFVAITLWHVLEHLTKPEQVLKEINEMLLPEGKLFIALPNAYGWQAAWFGRNWLHLDVPRHLFHFSQRALKKILQKQNFKILKWFHQEFEYDVMGWVQSFLNQFSTTKNIFFHLLTGKKTHAKQYQCLFHLIAGAFLFPFFLPLQCLSVVAKRGGTLVVIVQKS